MRDRIALDYFEKVHKKTNFGSFGISRGAINAAMTAGVDPRLSANVFALGGSDLPKIFHDSDVGGIRKYQRRAAAKLGLTKDQLEAWFEDQIKTDPKNLAKYIDSNGTMLILAAFDSSVPISQGLKLRQQMGRPKTVILPSGHVTALLFTQFVPLLLPERSIALFPLDYVESESISFFNETFDKPEKTPLRLVPIRVLQMPFEFIITMFDYVF